jgi:hypothetical protein
MSPCAGWKRVKKCKDCLSVSERISPRFSHGELRSIFTKHDRSGTGCLSRSEVLLALGDLGMALTPEHVDALMRLDDRGNRTLRWDDFRNLAYHHKFWTSLWALGENLLVLFAVAMFWYPCADMFGAMAMHILIERFVNTVCFMEGEDKVCLNSEAGAGLMRAGSIFILYGIFLLIGSGMIGVCFASILLTSGDAERSLSATQNQNPRLDMRSGHCFGRFVGCWIGTRKIYLVRLLIYNFTGFLAAVCWLAFDLMFDGFRVLVGGHNVVARLAVNVLFWATSQIILVLLGGLESSLGGEITFFSLREYLCFQQEADVDVDDFPVVEEYECEVRDVLGHGQVLHTRRSKRVDAESRAARLSQQSLSRRRSQRLQQ